MVFVMLRWVLLCTYQISSWKRGSSQIRQQVRYLKITYARYVHWRMLIFAEKSSSVMYRPLVFWIFFRSTYCTSIYTTANIYKILVNYVILAHNNCMPYFVRLYVGIFQLASMHTRSTLPTFYTCSHRHLLYLAACMIQASLRSSKLAWYYCMC